LFKLYHPEKIQKKWEIHSKNNIELNRKTTLQKTKGPLIKKSAVSGVVQCRYFSDKG